MRGNNVVDRTVGRIAVDAPATALFNAGEHGAERRQFVPSVAGTLLSNVVPIKLAVREEPFVAVLTAIRTRLLQMSQAVFMEILPLSFDGFGIAHAPSPRVRIEALTTCGRQTAAALVLLYVKGLIRQFQTASTTALHRSEKFITAEVRE